MPVTVFTQRQSSLARAVTVKAVAEVAMQPMRVRPIRPLVEGDVPAGIVRVMLVSFVMVYARETPFIGTWLMAAKPRLFTLTIVQGGPVPGQCQA